jgi:hypothetical protein
MVAFGRAACVIRYEIGGPERVVVPTIRRQREQVCR